jgi:hypothetical protein
LENEWGDLTGISANAAFFTRVANDKLTVLSCDPGAVSMPISSATRRTGFEPFMKSN